MFGDERESIRSPTTSRNGPMSRTNDRSYQQRSSITEDTERDDNEYEEPSNDLDEQPSKIDRPPPPPQEQYISALRYRFPNRPKTDYAYSKPVAPANVPASPLPPPAPAQSTSQSGTSGTTGNARAQSSGPYQTTTRPSIGGTGSLDIGSDRTFPKPALRRVTPDQQNTYARRLSADANAPASSIKPPGTGPTVRINEGVDVANRTIPSRYPAQSNIPQGQESTFEKVPSHGGPVSYLGTGTFSQFEHCLRECLERERRRTGITSQITRQDIPSSINVNEYLYDPCISSSSAVHPVLHSTISQYCPDYPSQACGIFTLDDIRHINVALSRSGISLYPYQRSFCHEPDPCVTSIPCGYPNIPPRTGNVVSACRVVEDDLALLYNNRG
ncbi:unnamed protein product [Adineta ricciae]|uniref:Uncharacterized protein n=1 Tax=Adineta ricciae TaxID=249248 RepID=A0A813Z9R4_ADIRI|nr:unnamed protein product [Adineta ricciae]